VLIDLSGFRSWTRPASSALIGGIVRAREADGEVWWRAVVRTPRLLPRQASIASSCHRNLGLRSTLLNTTARLRLRLEPGNR
jgi:hypothetical protein